MASSIWSLNSNVTSPIIPPTSVPEVNIIHGTHSQLMVFLVLNIWPSHFGIPLLLAVIYFKKIQRNATFINLCVTFIIAGISSTLLAYAGKTTGPEPSPVLCLLQASLLYGYPPMTSVAAFALVLQMFLVVRSSYYGGVYLENHHLLRTWGMVISPYIAFAVAFLATAIIGAATPSHVSRDRRYFYCSVRCNPLTDSLTVFAAIFLFATVFVEGWLSIILYKRYAIIKSKGFNVWEELDYSMPIRVIAYGLYSTIALSLSLLSIKAPNSPVPDLMIATGTRTNNGVTRLFTKLTIAATVMLFIFATQRDIVKGLCFWHRS